MLNFLKRPFLGVKMVTNSALSLGVLQTKNVKIVDVDIIIASGAAAGIKLIIVSTVVSIVVINAKASSNFISHDIIMLIK